MNRSPAFQPRASTSARSGGSSSSASQVTASCAASALAGGDQRLARSSPRPSASARASPGRQPALDPQEADEVDDRREGRQALPDDRQERPSSSSDGSPIDPPSSTAAWRNGRSRSIRSSGSSRRIHWPFSHSSRSRSNRAPPFWTCSMSNRASISSSEGRPPPSRAPAEVGEVVDEPLADEALGAVVVDRRLALALAHLGPVGVEDQRQVAEDRDRMAERLEQQDVLGRVADVVLAADHVADLHRGVVDHDEVVERRAVGPDDHEVAAEVGRVDLDPVADQVVPADDPGADAEAGRGPPALGRRAARSSARQVGAAADVAGRLLGGLLGLAIRLELVGRAEAGIGEVGGEEARPRPPCSGRAAASGGTGRTARSPRRRRPVPRPR